MHKFVPSMPPAQAKKVWVKPSVVRIGSIGDVAGSAGGTSQLSNFQLVTS